MEEIDALPSRFPFIRWSLLAVVVLVGIWLPGRVLPGVVLVVLANVFVRSLSAAGRILPERVATHFNFSRAADGWMRRRSYLVLVASITVVVAGLVPLGLFVAGMRAGDVKIERLALWIACLTLGLLLGAHELTVEANQREPAEIPRTVWLLLAVFLVAISLWGLAFSLPW